MNNKTTKLILVGLIATIAIGIVGTTTANVPLLIPQPASAAVNCGDEGAIITCSGGVGGIADIPGGNGGHAVNNLETGEFISQGGSGDPLGHSGGRTVCDSSGCETVGSNR